MAVTVILGNRGTALPGAPLHLKNTIPLSSASLRTPLHHPPPPTTTTYITTPSLTQHSSFDSSNPGPRYFDFVTSHVFQRSAEIRLAGISRAHPRGILNGRAIKLTLNSQLSPSLRNTVRSFHSTKPVGTHYPPLRKRSPVCPADIMAFSKGLGQPTAARQRSFSSYLEQIPRNST